MIVHFCFVSLSNQNGNKKRNIHREKFDFGTEEDSEDLFNQTYYRFHFSSCDKTKLPVDPYMAFMNAFGHTLGRICFAWREIARTVNSQGLILKTRHLLRSTQPFSTLKIFFGFKRDKKKKKTQ